MFDPDMGVETVFMLAGRIMHDRVVSSRHTALLRAFRPTNKQLVAPSFDYYVQVLVQMSATEKRDLKQRIQARSSGRLPN